MAAKAHIEPWLARSPEAPPPGRFRLWRPSYTRTTDPWRVYCLLGADRPKVIRGYGGWGQTEREGRRSVATFGGQETLAYSVTIRLDRTHGRGRDQDVARQMASLERLCGYPAGPPPVVNFAANVAHDQDDEPGLEWLCESLEWGDSVATDAGVLVWQEATLILGVDERAEVKDPGRAAFARHELHKGQNLREFARRWLGDASRWKDVASLNRENRRCPQGPEHRAARAVTLLVPPREPKSKKRSRRGRR